MPETPKKDLLQSALGSFVEAMEPLFDALGDEDVAKAVLEDLGQNPNAEPAPKLDAAALARVNMYAGEESPGVESFLSAFDDAVKVVHSMYSLLTTPSEQEAGDEFVAVLLAMLTTSYIKQRRPVLYGILRVLGFVEEGVLGHAVPLFRPERMSEFCTDTYRYFAARWRDDEEHGHARQFADGFFFPIAAGLMVLEGAYLQEKSNIHFRALHGWDHHPILGPQLRIDQLNDRALTVRITRDGEGHGESLDLNFQTVPEKHGGPGLMVVAKGGPITFETPSITYTIKPPGLEVAILVASVGQMLTQFAKGIEFGIARNGTGNPYTLLSKGTRLELLPGNVKLELGKATGGRFELDAALIVDTAQTDGFLKKLLPAATMRVDVKPAVCYDPGRGLFLEGGGGLRINIPLARSFGSLTLEQIQLALVGHSAIGADGKRKNLIALDASTVMRVKLGPITAVVEEMGFTLKWAGKEVDVGFSPPNGVGFSVDSGVVRGGGYLYYDRTKSQYAGVLQLELQLEKKRLITAIGLITTKLPNGEHGFSLLLIISVEKLGWQLGAGFVMDAIGGILGLNRSVDPEVLRAGIRSNAVGAIMFPKKPVENAPKVLKTIAGVFPPAAGQFVIGLMVRVNYKADFVKFSVGVIVELKDPVRIVLLGKIEVRAPDPKAPLVEFNLDIIGILDLGAKEASLDAALYDSRVLVYTITGDMAMRLGWGDQSHFGLSIGGFHPTFSAPAKFPKLRRASISMGVGENPRLRSESYFAVTTNTFQMGARTELYAAAMGFSVSGFFGWDLIVQFDPFRFRADFAAGLSLMRNTKTLMSVKVEGSLVGFTPLAVSGSASFKILFLEVSFGFQFTLIDDPAPPRLKPIAVLQLLVDALQQPDNWAPELPTRYGPLASLRRSASSERVLVHPLAKLSVSQAVVPLDVTIEVFGDREPDGPARFSITAAKIGTQTATIAPVEAAFAPAQFFAMTDAEKLTRPSFEKLRSGVRLGTDALTHGAGLEASVTYESSIIDPATAMVYIVAPYPLDGFKMNAFAKTGAVAQGATWHTGGAKYASLAGPKVTYQGAQYEVVDTSDMKPAAGAPAAKSYTAALEAKGKLAGLQVVGWEEVAK